MLHVVSGMSSLCFFVNFILISVPPFLIHRFLYLSLLLFWVTTLLISFNYGLNLPVLQILTPPPVVSLFLPDCHDGLLPGPFFLSYSVFVFSFSLFFSFLCRALDQAGHLVSFWAHVNLPHRIVSYRKITNVVYNEGTTANVYTVPWCILVLNSLTTVTVMVSSLHWSVTLPYIQWLSVANVSLINSNFFFTYKGQHGRCTGLCWFGSAHEVNISVNTSVILGNIARMLFQSQCPIWAPVR